ncbi:MAG: molecular chaperone HscC [Firmicutes bacterium HGW-Firmicutes-1]|jgi:molecular chaperone HscC|nr:MAG: molecular chaperone HscC [Firmicutes bacterium HGW-Firmicutes-1]
MVTIGIDLGTTNSLVSYWSEKGPVIIPNVLGSNLTPSVVSINDQNEILVGEVAQQRLITHPNLTASTFKRYMGTKKRYQLGKYTFSPEELTSFLLSVLKADAEAYLSQEVHNAVISIPAYFNDSQRRATKQAAELAGLKVERLISEPTAAAICYGLHQQASETKFMIFDLGGGTFDVSILELFEGVMEVRSISGDSFLGGEDFTNLLISDFAEVNQINLQTLDSKTKAALYKQAELCKRQLSEKICAIINLTIKEKHFEYVINRSDFDKLATNLMLRMRQPMNRALNDSSLVPEELNAVILIGGATRMPIIKSIITKMFHRLPYSNINPDEAVALGAAIQIALKERNEALNEIILTDVCPFTLGTSVAKQVGNGKMIGGCFFPIIERNTIIPVSRVERLTTCHDYQDIIVIDIFQGENHNVDENVKLGKLQISVPAAPAGMESVDVRYTYDINGILEVELTTISTGEVKRIVIENSPGNMSKKEIDAILRNLKGLKINPRDKTENRLLIAKGERLFEETLGDRRRYIGELLAKFEYTLSLQDERTIQKTAKELREVFGQIEGSGDY